MSLVQQLCELHSDYIKCWPDFPATGHPDYRLALTLTLTLMKGQHLLTVTLTLIFPPQGTLTIGTFDGFKELCFKG